MMRVMSTSPRGMFLLSTTYVVALAVLGLVLFAAVMNAQIVWQTESQLGYSLSCAEAYNQRGIDAYFYPERSFYGNLLYLYSLFSPVILLGFVTLMIVLGAKGFSSEHSLLFKRRSAWLIASGVILLIGLLAYAPVIYTIACATE